MRFTAAILLTTCLLSLLAASPARAQSELTPVPEMKGYVADAAGVLTLEEKDRLTGLIRDVAKRTGSQLGVVVVDHTDPEAIEDFAQRVFTTWKLGRKGIDDGVLLVLAINNQGRRLRIQVGYGLEGTITDAVAKRVLAEEVRPTLEQAGPGWAVNSGVNALTSLMLKANIREPKAMVEAREAAMERLQWGTLAQVGLLMLAVVLMTRRLRLATRLAVIGVLSLAVSALYVWVAGNVWWAYGGAVWLGIAVVMAGMNWRKATQRASAVVSAPADGVLPAASASAHAPLPLRNVLAPVPLPLRNVPAPAPAKASRRNASRKGKSWRHVSPATHSGKDAAAFVAEEHVPVDIGLPLMLAMYFVASAIGTAIGAVNGSSTKIAIFAGVGWWILATMIFTVLTARHGWQDPVASVKHRGRRRGRGREGDGGSDSYSGGWSSDSGGSSSSDSGGSSGDSGSGGDSGGGGSSE